MYNRFPLLSRALIFVFLPMFALTYYLWSLGLKSLPTAGDYSSPYISKEVTIQRDTKGIPHITAQLDLDAFFAVGYAQAQDRLWQLEIQKRTVEGRLSEILGEELLPQDVWMHTLGIYDAAVRTWENFTEEEKSTLTAYTNGVNQWIQDVEQLPVEFSLLGVTPEPWTEIHSLAWAKMFALNISGNLRQEIVNYVINSYLPEEQAKILSSSYPEGGPFTVGNGEYKQFPTLAFNKIYRQSLNLEKQLGIGGKFVGSNAWVVSPKISTEKVAMLANDPHLALQMPSSWYAMSVKGKHINVSGMSLVGLPIVIFGRNPNIAWGGTAMLADVQDLYIEKIDTNSTHFYEYDNELLPIESEVKKIKVKQKFPSRLRPENKPVEILVRKTKHGPILTNYSELSEAPVSLKWTALSKIDRSYLSLLKINYANNWQSFNEALRDYVAPALNFVYIDKGGNIGYIGAGKIPIRKTGNGSQPLPGWTSQTDWDGSIPFEHWPRSYNPDKGFIVTANNKVIDDHYPYFISNDWALPARAERIEQLLKLAMEKNGSISLEDNKVIQSDFTDLTSYKLLPFLTSLKAETTVQREAINYLKNWTAGEMTEKSIGATIYFSWTAELKYSMLDDDLSHYWNHSQDRNVLTSVIQDLSTEQMIKLLDDKSYDWCDDIISTNTESCSETALLALDNAIEQITTLLGSNMNKWAWGKVHETIYSHTPFSSFKPIADIFEKRVPNGGAPNTVNAAGANFSASEGYEQKFGPTFRQIIGLSDESAMHLMMNTTGQSGNVFSKHYDDMYEDFKNIKYIDINKGLDTTNPKITLKPE